jgi:hypothetical protein
LIVAVDAERAGGARRGADQVRRAVAELDLAPGSGALEVGGALRSVAVRAELRTAGAAAAAPLSSQRGRGGMTTAGIAAVGSVRERDAQSGRRRTGSMECPPLPSSSTEALARIPGRSLPR